MIRHLRSSILLGVLIGAFLGSADRAVAQQPLQWNYGFDNNGNAVATYPGNINVLGVCVAGCSSISLNTPNTWTATQTFAGSASTFSNLENNQVEVTTITAGAPAATQNFDTLTQGVQLFTSSAANNWTLNIRGSAGTPLSTALTTGQAISFAVVTTQGASPFFNNVVQIDGTTTGVTIKWQGGAPVAGNANGLDVYTYTVIKTAGTPTYTVLASLVQFK